MAAASAVCRCHPDRKTGKRKLRQHVPRQELSAFVRRVLKPDGRLIVAEPHFVFPILQVQNLLLTIHPLNGDLHFLSRRGLRALLARCGFRTVAQRRAAFLARYTVAERGDSSKPA